MESVADWMIDKFNSISRNHRLVASTLEREMKAQKEKIQVAMNLYSCFIVVEKEMAIHACAYIFIFIQYSL